MEAKAADRIVHITQAYEEAGHVVAGLKKLNLDINTVHSQNIANITRIEGVVKATAEKIRCLHSCSPEGYAKKDLETHMARLLDLSAALHKAKIQAKAAMEFPIGTGLEQLKGCLRNQSQLPLELVYSEKVF